MPEKIELEISDVIELRRFQMWVKREMTIFKREPAIQKMVAENIDKVTTLPLEELVKRL